LSYTIYPGGRAGRIGLTTPPIEFEPGCYALKLWGDSLVWGSNLEDFTIGALVGDKHDKQLYDKRLPTFGEFEAAIFWLAETQTITPITLYLQFGYGHADAKSRVNISRFEVLPVSIGHCK
jgi:hypothetical protein